MKTILDTTTREGLIGRINTLSDTSNLQWGKMTVYQMIKHCQLWEEMVLTNKVYKRAFLGRLFGKMALKGILKDEKPLKHNTPTICEFIIKETNSDISIEKTKWIATIEQYAHFSNNDFIHPFFGKMTKEEIGIMAYKHIDHHLRQFNC